MALACYWLPRAERGDGEGIYTEEKVSVGWGKCVLRADEQQQGARTSLAEQSAYENAQGRRENLPKPTLGVDGKGSCV
jgi:hypothetical protein